ncbi:MAG: hypothetical protein ACOYYS_08630 [Chloroflexota bacterium]
MAQPERIAALRIRLLVTTCLGLAGAVAFIVLYWVFSGSLEDIETIYAGVVFALIVGGIAQLARRSRPTLAAWLLVGLLFLLITLDALAYGVGTPAAAAYVIPILLAAFCLGFWPSLSVAVAGTASSWLAAWLQTSGAYGQPPADISQLTFNAPVLTAILLVSGAMAGSWAGHLEKIIRQ